MSIVKRLRNVLLIPLAEGRLSVYFALGSFVLAFAALLYAGRIFELQRRDALLFELADRHQQFERAILLAHCLRPNAGGQIRQQLEDLRKVSDQLRATLTLKREATLGQLLDDRDSVLTVGSSLVMAIERENMAVRSNAALSELSRLDAVCGR